MTRVFSEVLDNTECFWIWSAVEPSKSLTFYVVYVIVLLLIGLDSKLVVLKVR